MHRLCSLAPIYLFLCSLLVVCLGAVQSGNQPGATPSNAESTELTAGTSIPRELAPGRTQLFEIALAAGQFLRFSIDKGDLALSLVLFSPAGQKVLEQVSHDYELLDVSIVADETGVYRLEIHSLESEEWRHYELRVEPVKSATVRDRKDSAARQAVAKASVIRGDWTEASLRHAIEKYDEAALLWLRSGNVRSAVRASMEAGEVCFVLGEYREALKRYQKAAAEAHGVASVEESEAFSQTGRLYSYLGLNDEAKRQLVKALDFLAAPNVNKSGTFKAAYALALSNLGEVTYSKGDLVKSLENFKYALKLLSEIGDRNGMARVHLFMGYEAGGLGEPEKAVSEISLALDLFRAVTNKSGEALSLTALGLSRSLKRDEEHAIKIHREAMAIFRTLGDRQSEAITLNALGQAYENLGDYSVALDYHRQALKLFQDNGSLDFASATMFEVARIFRLVGDVDQSLTYYEQCLRLSRAAQKRRTEANALNEVAVIYASQGRREKTIRQYAKILKFYAAIGDRREQALALINLGDFHLRLGEKQDGLDLYKRALPLSEQAGDKGVLVSTLYSLARVNRDLGALEEALSYIKQSIKIIEDLRTNVANPDFRTSYFAGVRKQYELCVDILMQLDHAQPGQGFAAAALLTSESARARSLIDILVESRLRIRQEAPPELQERERELQALLRSQAQYQMDLAVSGENSAESVEAAQQMDRLRAEYQELEAQLREENPRLLTLTRPNPLTMEEIQAELRDGDTTLLEYALGDERSYLWAVTADSLRGYELPSRTILEAAGRDLYKTLTARQTIGGQADSAYQANVERADGLYDEQARNLSQLLLGQVADHLQSKRLIVVTEGVLQFIPFDVLPAPPEQQVGPNTTDTPRTPTRDLSPLIATTEIVTLPSISTLATIRRGQRGEWSRNKIVAVLADPVFSRNDDRVQSRQQTPEVASFVSDQSSSDLKLRDFEALARGGGTMRLAHASEEADAILAVTPRGAAMVAKGFDASRETAMSSLVGEYQIVHFATHGFLNSEDPELSGIALTMVNRDGTKTDGFMPLYDIYNLNLSAELTVLSACETALGKDVKGEGLIGLTRAFMYAGSRSVVASLWKVDDRATAVLMADFYKSMLQDGMPPAAALRAAKQRLRQQKAWSAPYFWAGFVLQGEYKEPIVVSRNSWLPMGLAVSLAAIVISLGLMILQRRHRRSHPRARATVV